MDRKLVFIVAVLAVFFISAGTARATTSVTGCGTLSTDGGNYAQTVDFMATATPCITIGANNITYDGQGHFIGGGAFDKAFSIVNYDNITIKNVYANSTANAVSMDTTKYDTLSNVNATGTTTLVFNGPVSNSTFTSCNFTGSDTAIYFYSSNNNTINNSFLSGVSYCIRFQNPNPTNNLFSNNWFNCASPVHMQNGIGSNNTWNSSMVGNYWGNPTKTGFSDTCTDANTDGICDSSYGIYADGRDYLPKNYTGIAQTGTMSISFNTPQNTTYYNNTVLVNFTPSSSTLLSVPCYYQVDGNKTTIGNVTNGTAFTQYYNNQSGVHNVTVTCGFQTNVSASVFYTTYAGINNATLSSSGGWSISEGALTTISCSAINGTGSVYKDGVAISNPYTLTGSFGSYNFTCYSSANSSWSAGYAQQTLLVGLGAFSCFDSTTGIWRQDMSIDSSTGNISIDFSAFTALGQTWWDLRDVNFLNVSANATWREGQKMIINTTYAKQFSIVWGNYFGNQTQQVGSSAGAVALPISNYSQASAYAHVTMKLEETGITALPPSANNTLTFGCDTGTNSQNISNTSMYVPTYRPSFTYVKGFATYADNSRYVRQVLVFSQAAEVSIYMIDATKYSVLQIPLQITDLGYASWYITVYKPVGGSSAPITQGYFDANNQFITYLIKDEQYSIRITNGASTREIGFLYASAAGLQTISIGTITTVPTIVLVGNTVTASAEVVGSDIRVTYGDTLQHTTSVRIRIYENTTQTPFYDNTFTGQQNITLTINSINLSSFYNVHFDVIHQNFGSSPVSFLITAGGATPTFTFGLGSGSWILQAAGLIIIILIGFIATPRNRLGILVMMGVIVGMMFLFGWFVFGLAVAGCLIAFVVLSVLYEIKRGGDA
jgi:hypothetical protein